MSVAYTYDVLIVGAGLAGLTAARELSVAGLDVIVVEKGRLPGGRLATLAVGEGRADAGAQFFTVRTDEFAEVVDSWRREGLVFEWSRGWSDGSLAETVPDGYPRYAAIGGFGRLAQSLTQGLSVALSEEVLSLSQQSDHWEAVTGSDKRYSARSLLLTPPAPQSRKLLAASNIRLPDDVDAALAAISYAPCLCGLYVLSGAIDLPEPGALQRPEAAVSWLADNRRKGISPEADCITVHAGPDASLARWDDSDDEVLDWLASELRPYLHSENSIQDRRLKRWSYALPTRLHPDPVLVGGTRLPLVFAGDAFGSMRVEGAFLSGLAAAKTIAGLLK